MIIRLNIYCMFVFHTCISATMSLSQRVNWSKFQTAQRLIYSFIFIQSILGACGELFLVSSLKILIYEVQDWPSVVREGIPVRRSNFSSLRIKQHNILEI